MTIEARIVDPVVLFEFRRLFALECQPLRFTRRPRGVWKIGPRRDKVRYALAVYEGVVQGAYEISYWQPAWTTPYQTRKFDKTEMPGRGEFVGSV